MKVKFYFSDSGTGEEDQVTLTVPNMSHDSFQRVFNQYVNVDQDDEEPQFWELKSLINHGDDWAAIFTHDCPYFGKILLTGIIYTNFRD